MILMMAKVKLSYLRMFLGPLSMKLELHHVLEGSDLDSLVRARPLISQEISSWLRLLWSLFCQIQLRSMHQLLRHLHGDRVLSTRRLDSSRRECASGVAGLGVCASLA